MLAWKRETGHPCIGCSDRAMCSAIFVSVYAAETQLSALVDRAATGEEIVIAKNGVPSARLVAIAGRGERRKPANAQRIDAVAPNFDEADPVVADLFTCGDG